MSEIKRFYGSFYEEIIDQVTEYTRQKCKETSYAVSTDILYKGEDFKGKFCDIKITILEPTKTIQKSIVFRKGGRLCDPDVDTQYNKFFDNKDREVIDYQFSENGLFVRYKETIYEEEN